MRDSLISVGGSRQISTDASTCKKWAFRFWGALKKAPAETFEHLESRGAVVEWRTQSKLALKQCDYAAYQFRSKMGQFPGAIVRG